MLIEAGAKLNQIAYKNGLARSEYRSTNIDVDLSTALNAAIWSKSMACLTLVQSYQPIKYSDLQLDKFTQTPFTLLIKADFIGGLKLFVKTLASIKPSNNGYTLLHTAVEYNSLKSLKYLIKQKPEEINILFTYQRRDEKGDYYIIKQTPLITALLYGGLQAAEILLASNADADKPGQFVCYDRSDLTSPGTNHYLIPLKELLKDKGRLKKLGIEAALQFIQELLHKTTEGKITKAFLKKEALVEWLSGGFYVNDRIMQTLTVEVAKFLIDYGANVNQTDKYGRNSPLHLAVQAANKQLIRLLLDQHADSRIKNAKGQSAFEMTDDTSILQMCHEHKISKQ